MRTKLQSEGSILIQDYRQFGARQAEVGSLRNVLAHLGVLAPHTGEPYTEELLFGIGGGIGLGYSVYHSAESTSPFIATRIITQESTVPGFLQMICERLGIGFQVEHSSNSLAAEQHLKIALRSGLPPIVWVDPGALPYYGTPFAHHTLVVHGVDEEHDNVGVADRSKLPLKVSRSDLATARQSGQVPRFRALLVSSRNQAVDLETAVQKGLRDCCEQMREGFGPVNLRSNFGLKSLEKWATLLIDERDKRGWTVMFLGGLDFFEALAAVFDQIENRGDGGGGLRLMFADFLAEASTLLNGPRLLEAADQFRRSAGLWDALAEALLPDSVSLFAETKRLACRKRTLFEHHGGDTNGETQTIDNRLVEIKTMIEQNFPLSKTETRDLLCDLRGRVLAIHECESGAISSLELAL
jgi:uncharacterized protein DUF4872/butirosin biosynthesis protein H-like